MGVRIWPREGVREPEPMDPVAAAPTDGLEEVTGEVTAWGAVEVLKILAKKDPRSNTAIFMPGSWKGRLRHCPNLQTTPS